MVNRSYKFNYVYNYVSLTEFIEGDLCEVGVIPEL